MDMWFLSGAYGPYKWLPVSQMFYSTIKKFINKRGSILEFGSSTGHISFRLAREGHPVTLLDIRPVPIAEAKTLYQKAGVKANFIVSDFFEHKEKYDLIWNSGLIQCLSSDDRKRLLIQAITCSPQLLLFYPDTDNPRKKRGDNVLETPGVEGSKEYSVIDVPQSFFRHYNKVYHGRLSAAKLKTPFDMLWLHGDNR